MKSDQTIIGKTHMEQLNFITNLLGIKDPNITILDYQDCGTHKEISASLDYPAPTCHNCHGQTVKYDFQKLQNPLSGMCWIQDSNPIAQTAFPLSRVQEDGCRRDLSGQEKPSNRNRRQSENRSKTHRKESMTAIAQSLAVSTSTVIRKLKIRVQDRSELAAYSHELGRICLQEREDEFHCTRL